MTCDTTYSMYIPGFNLNLNTCKQKAQKTLKNPKRAKISAKISKMRFLQKNRTYVDKYTVGHLHTKFEEFILIYEAMIAKNVWPTFGCKLGQSDQIVTTLKLNMSRHLPNVSIKFIFDISKHVEKKPGKLGRTWPRHIKSVF